MIRCYKCATFPKHLFRECLSKNCGCNCVKQLYKMLPNLDLEKVSNKHPRFMDVKDAEIKSLPDLGYAFSNFNKVKKWEWAENEPKIRNRGRCKLK